MWYRRVHGVGTSTIYGPSSDTAPQLIQLVLYNVEACCRIQGCCKEVDANYHESQMGPEARSGFGHTRWRGEVD